MKVEGTISASSAVSRIWDVVVVGAGPAGCVTAIEAANAQRSVLIVERKSFPRAKVCGCCLNRRALAGLSSLGLGEMTKRVGAPRIDRFIVQSAQAHAEIGVEGGAALTRSRLDSELVLAAIERGAHFLPEVTAHLGATNSSHRLVLLTTNEGPVEILAKVVIAADGLGGRLLTRVDEDDEWISKTSWIGAGTSVPASAVHVPRGAILMAVGRSGYVGLTQVEDGSINIAAAMNPREIKRQGGMGPLAASLIRSCKIEIDTAIENATWKGTGALTRQPVNLGSERVLVVGDAAGYVEPFTGQGISWAIESGRKVAPMVDQALEEGWSESIVERWRRAHHHAVVRHQSICRKLSWGLRSSILVRCGLQVVSRFPAIAGPFTRSIDW